MPFDAGFKVSRRFVLSALAVPIATYAAPAREGTLLVGQSAPLSGAMAPTMVGVLAGQQMAIDEANRSGGIHGRRLELVMLDDGFDPARTLENARTLVEQRQVVALFGSVGTTQTAALLPYVAEKKVPLISAYTGSPALRTKHNPFFFTTQASYADELVRMVRNLKSVQSTRIAVVYQNNEFGKLLLPVAEKVIAAEGCEVTVARPLEVSGGDAVAVAQAVAASRPQAVVMIVAGPAVVAYVKANRAHAGVPIYTFSLSVGSAILKALGEDARGLAVSRATPYPWRATTALARTFAQQMAAAGKPVDYDHFAGYINGRVLVEGLRAAGKNPTPAGVAKAMEKMGRLDLGGYAFEFSPENHHGSNFVEITVVGPNGNFMR
ncbi:ABC transporter substrate-binding protein [Ramlibacter pallidus]|uniref:ABC transporter substrate-binding protein n=1 Tax=Ramlibacter pallidus TaxID=2780087 RepID=A0ABR9S7P4_9BURK|nr:ABC transporter substrate-binding protein [Ramlibacter pallidus]MBE7369540.1 ABC transporter substrate-binding protein [Ramlibacter pallidus]